MLIHVGGPHARRLESAVKSFVYDVAAVTRDHCTLPEQPVELPEAAGGDQGHECAVQGGGNPSR